MYCCPAGQSIVVEFAEFDYYVYEGAGEVVLNYTVVVNTVDGSATGRDSSAVSANFFKHTCWQQL